MSQRADLTTSVAVVAFLTQLIFAQLTLVLVISLVIVGRVSRWRPLWLAVPAIAGVGWLAAVGVRPAVAGYLAGGSRLLGLLARHELLGTRAEALMDLLAGWRRWLPGQLPLALTVATAQAAILSLPGRIATRRPCRSGAIIAVRSGYLAATLRRGELATYDGCCLGIVPGTGRRAAISWREAETGVLCAGQDAAAVSATGRDLALAAIQHRKTVVIIDLAGGCGDVIGMECARVDAPMRQSAHYDPLSGASPPRATKLAMAMIDWTGVAHARQLFCEDYLKAVFTVLAASREGASATVLDDILRLMTPGALRARLARLRDPRLAAGSLAARVADLSTQLEADPATLAPMEVQLAELSSVALARLIRPASDGASISIEAALARREVVVFSLDRLLLGEPAAMIARLAVADVIEILTERRDLGSHADGLVWINGCEAIGQSQLRDLVALGERTGTAVVLGTALGSAATTIAADMNVVTVRGASPAGQGQAPIHDDMADLLTTFHAPGYPDVLSLAVRAPSPRRLAGCKVVR